MDTRELSRIRDCLTSGPNVYLLVIVGKYLSLYFWERAVILTVIKIITFYIGQRLFHQSFLICRVVLNGPLRIVKHIFITTTTTQSLLHKKYQLCKITKPIPKNCIDTILMTNQLLHTCTWIKVAGVMSRLGGCFHLLLLLTTYYIVIEMLIVQHLKSLYSHDVLICV